MSEQTRWALLGLCAGMLLGTFAVVLGARAHDAPSGWRYPYQCCSGIDCRPVPASMIGEGPAGYTIRATGEVIGYRDAKVRNSPDGLFHWCSVGGRDDGATICLFVPPRAL